MKLIIHDKIVCSTFLDPFVLFIVCDFSSASSLLDNRNYLQLMSSDLQSLEDHGELVNAAREQDPGHGVGGGQHDVDHKLAESVDNCRHNE